MQVTENGTLKKFSVKSICPGTMDMKTFQENKGIIITGILLVLFSVGFTAIINFNHYYDGNIGEVIAYFIRTIACLCISVGVFALAYKYGRGFVLKYGWVFVPIGIVLSLVDDAQGCVDVFGYSIEIVSLTNILAVLGIATYFYKYCLNVVVHTIVFWIAIFLFLIISERGYLTLILFVMMGLILLSAEKNKLISKKSIWMVNIVLYVVLTLRTINIILMGIMAFADLFYDSSYMAFIARSTYMKIKWFGQAVEPWLIGGDIECYKLLCIFGLFGIVAGAVVFIVLTSFVFFVCKKCFKNIFTDTTSIACATASILLVRFILSMLMNFGIVIEGLFSPIPILSDGVCGYAAIFVLVGLLLSKTEGGTNNGTDKNKRITDMSHQTIVS